VHGLGRLAVVPEAGLGLALDELLVFGVQYREVKDPP